MKTIIAGSRSILKQKHVDDAIKESGFEITTVLCGGAGGADTLGRIWAERNNTPVMMFYPNWDKYGRKAGILRNIEMGDNADALIAVWDGKSKGTKHMIDYAVKKGLKLFVKVIE